MCTIETSGSLTSFASALLQFQALTHGVLKDSQNPHFRNRYASLEAVIETARPGLQKAGLAFLQAPGRLANGVLPISTMVIHAESGEWVRSTMDMPVTRNDPQGIGSATTYGLRYSLMAMLGLPPLDDDAEATQPQKPLPSKQQQATMPPAPTIGPASNPSKAVYVENSLERIAGFDFAPNLLKWAKTEREKVWPQYGIEVHDPDGQRIVRVYKDRMAILESQSEPA